MCLLLSSSDGATWVLHHPLPPSCSPAPDTLTSGPPAFAGSLVHSSSDAHNTLTPCLASPVQPHSEQAWSAGTSGRGVRQTGARRSRGPLLLGGASVRPAVLLRRQGVRLWSAFLHHACVDFAASGLHGPACSHDPALQPSPSTPAQAGLVVRLSDNPARYRREIMEMESTLERLTLASSLLFAAQKKIMGGCCIS